MSYRGNKSKAKESLNWKDVRKHIEDHGMRNSNVMAIAPTATIGYINGTEQSIEPNFSVLFVYENKSGNSYIINEHFVNDMKAEGLWTPELSSLVKNGDMFKLIESNSVRQKWMDQSISFNLYNSTTSLKYLNDLYMACWEAGLKTTYYLRNRAASKVEKSTETSEVEPSACSIDAMKNGESCESCQ